MTAYGAFSIASLILALILMPAAPVGAAEQVKATTIMIDFDGDGIDDNLADVDGNTIPDRFERKPAPAGESVPQGVLGDVFNAGYTPPTEIENPDHATAFGARLFPTRAILPHRAGFGADEKFGPGNDIGIGSLTSGCAGGICHF